jgi:hypothetical protein
VVTRRDKTLVLLLMANASMDAIVTSVHLSEVASRPVVAIFGLISAGLSAATGVYVVWSRDPYPNDYNPR